MKNASNVEATLGDLRASIASAWNAETTSDSDWSELNPSKGQCAVTALIVQDLLGGELLRAKVGEVSHYWNKLPDGTEVDLTREQFDRFVPVDIREITREYVLSFPLTRKRYDLLKSRIGARTSVH